MADPLYGLLAEFNDPKELIRATQAARDAGYLLCATFTPFPVEELNAILDFRENSIPRIALAGGVAGALIGLGMQMYVSFSYPLDVGGRPLYALSAFAVVTFELTVLFAALSPLVAMLWKNGLPRLHYPLFEAPRFHLASKDRFFLCIRADDSKFDLRSTREFLERVSAVSIEEVPL